MKFLKSLDGFTLVELMVVVAIIGILSAVAIPNFRTYQAKSKTSEAKLALASVYSAETSFASDFDTYGTCLVDMGYQPTDKNRYYASGFVSNSDGTAGSHGNKLAQENGAPDACVGGIQFFDATKVVGGKTGKRAQLHASTAGANVTATGFTAGASGYVDAKAAAASNVDQWTIDENKFLKHQTKGY